MTQQAYRFLKSKKSEAPFMKHTSKFISDGVMNDQPGTISDSLVPD